MEKLLRRKKTCDRALVFMAFLVLGLYGSLAPASAQLVKSVDAAGINVSDIDRSVEFFSKVLSFEKVSDIEVMGSEYERLQGVFGARMRIARMRLGEEFIDLTEYLTPRGRPIPVVNTDPATALFLEDRTAAVIAGRLTAGDRGQVEDGQGDAT